MLDTTPITNLLTLEQFDAWKGVYLDHVTGQRPDLVTAHKRALGPQSWCFRGTYRYWVWEDAAAGWTVYVSNKKGVGFEVKIGLDAGAALDAWADYLRRFRCM